MPNWCQNQLWIFAPEDVISEIAETKLSCEKIRPYPEDADDDWMLNNWGTRDFGPLEKLQSLGSHSSGMEVNEEDIYAWFDSAWDPPIPLVKFLLEKYQDRGIKLELEYFEEGNKMIGKVTAEKGKFIEEHCDYKNADELDNWLHSREHFIDSYMVDQIRTEEKFLNGSQD